MVVFLLNDNVHTIALTVSKWTSKWNWIPAPLSVTMSPKHMSLFDPPSQEDLPQWSGLPEWFMEVESPCVAFVSGFQHHVSLHGWGFAARMPVPCVWRSVNLPGTGVPRCGYEPPYACWEVNRGPLQERLNHWATQPSCIKADLGWSSVIASCLVTVESSCTTHAVSFPC